MVFSSTSQILTEQRVVEAVNVLTVQVHHLIQGSYTTHYSTVWSGMDPSTPPSPHNWFERILLLTVKRLGSPVSEEILVSRGNKVFLLGLTPSVLRLGGAHFAHFFRLGCKCQHYG